MSRWAGALLITSDVRTPWLPGFRKWHNLEHLPERMAVPGFIAARRFVSVGRSDHFLTLYQLASIEVLESASYRALLQAPSPTTIRVLNGAVTNTSRLLCRRAGGFVRGEGGIAILSSDTSLLTPAGIAALEGKDDVAAAHLLVPDARMTAAPSVALPHPGPARGLPDAMVLVESWSSGIEEAERATLDGSTVPNLYRLEVAVRS